LHRPSAAEHELEELPNPSIDLRARLVPVRGSVNGGARMSYVGNMGYAGNVRVLLNVRAGGHRTVSRKRERSDDDSTD